MITLALIGLGEWGLNHLRTIEEIPQAELKYDITMCLDIMKQKADENDLRIP